MPDRNFAERFLKDDTAKGYGKERQLTAQSFNLHVEKRDGRHAEGFAWSHYVGYRWTDDGEKERLIVLFGMRAVEVEGHNLGVLVGEIREGQLNRIQEMTTAKAQLLEAGEDVEPVITSVKMYPDFEEVLKELKGEEKDAAKGGFAQRF